MTTLAIIPARGGSKGISGKNLREIGGRSLLARTVAVACASKAIDHVIVTTDDEQIAAAARAAGALVPFMRPLHLATDDAPTIPVITHAVLEFEEYLGLQVDTIILLEPTVPFRTTQMISQAVSRFQQQDCRSVISVCPLERKPQNIYAKDRDEHLHRYIQKPVDIFTHRQDMAHLCRLSSGVYVVGRNDFMSTQKLTIEPIGYVETTALEAVNIDEEIDLLLAETISRHYGV